MVHFEFEQNRLASATYPLRYACSCSVKVPQRWQRNERFHSEYRANPSTVGPCAA